MTNAVRYLKAISDILAEYIMALWTDFTSVSLGGGTLHILLEIVCDGFYRGKNPI